MLLSVNLDVQSRQLPPSTSLRQFYPLAFSAVHRVWRIALTHVPFVFVISELWLVKVSTLACGSGRRNLSSLRFLAVAE